MYRADEGMGFLMQYENIAWFENNVVKILDRRVYPFIVRHEVCSNYLDVAKAIKDMVTQSAGPYQAAAMGMALAANEVKDKEDDEILNYLDKASYALSHARPTTSKKMEEIASECLLIAKECLKKSIKGDKLVEKLRIHAFDRINNNYIKYEKIASLLADKVPENGTILTQCFGETIIGTLFKELKRRGNNVKVYCAETRPYFQGARLTASVANEIGMDVTVISDNMVAYTMQNKGIDLFTSAADVITMDGHVVNKIGTYQMALMCKEFGIPYYVTGEPNKKHLTSDSIVIEERSPELLTNVFGTKIVEDGVKAFYPAFDITPPNLVSAVVSDKGVFAATELDKYYE